MYKIFIAEPDAINVNLIREAFVDTAFIISRDKKECDTIIVRSGTKLNQSFLADFPHLKNIIRIGTGLDNIDIALCKQLGIAIYNAAGANADAVAEYVTTMALFTTRRLHLLSSEDIKSYNRFKFRASGLHGATVGIVGFGNIGRLVQQKLAALEAKEFLIFDPYLSTTLQLPNDTHLVKLDELLENSRIITLHMPLTSETKHMISEAELGKLPEETVLINAARGGIVDEAALQNIMANKSITYVADTFEGEPHVNPSLLGHERIIVTPHIASLTYAAEAKMHTTAIAHLLDHQPVQL